MSLTASVLDQDRERIKDDLRGVIKGDVLTDDVSLQLYATDASIYEIKPLAVVRPRGLSDVVASVQYAAENRLPIHARGAGTGLAGESLGAGVIIDFSRYMRRVVRTDPSTITLQPGAVHANVNEYLHSLGRQFGPDPAMSSVTTFGSMISIDASGSHRLKYGSTRQHVRSLQLVLADGQVIEAAREPVAVSGAEPPTTKQRLVGGLVALISHHKPLIEQYQPGNRVNRCGYQLVDVLDNGTLDLAKLVSGSEGTLALITEATLEIQPLPKERGVALLFFERLDAAARAVTEILPFGPSACDLMDRRHLSLAREHTVHFDLLIPAQTEAALLVEYEGDSLPEVRDRLLAIIDRIRRKRRLAFHAVQAHDRLEMDLYWRLARKVVPTLHRLKGATRPLPFIEDLAVPPKVLPDFLVRMQNVLKAHQVTASLFAHAGHGQLHLRPFLDLSSPDDVARMAQLAADLYQEVIEVGGTISGEHATGLSRTSFLRQQYGPLVDVFAEVKQLFDPAGTLNPGKIVSDDPNLLTSNLRPSGMSASIAASDAPLINTEANATGVTPSQPIKLQLAWTLEEVAETVRNCNGCGACRSQLSDVRMCPIFRYATAEEATPRAKANLMRGVLTGALDPATLSTEDFKGVADLCVHCHMCRGECPASVDIPRLMAEGKGAYVRVNGLPLSQYFMSRIDALSSWATRVRPLSNWALGNRYARWLLDKTFGVAQGRRLPLLSQRTFQRAAIRKKLTRATRRSGQKVLYFVDTFANYYDPQLAESLIAILEHNAITVYVHPLPMSSAMPMIALGALGKAKQIAAKNVALLAEAVRMGYHIVATEPSAALCLKHEYVQLLGDDDARLVAENSSEACSYLWKLHQIGKLQLDLRPVNATLGYHLPCHLKALEVGSPGESLLRLIPGLVVSRVSGGCSGMAGTFGLQTQNYRSSLRAGRELIGNLRNPRLQAGTTECSTCKLQMEHGTDKPTIHPLKLLAHSYGLMPQVGSLLGARPTELRVR